LWQQVFIHKKRMCNFVCTKGDFSAQFPDPKSIPPEGIPGTLGIRALAPELT